MTPNGTAGEKTLILHIGLQKTGTSSIQVMLAGSADYLDTQGYHFPSLPDADSVDTQLSVSPFRHNRIAGTYADYPSSFTPLVPDALHSLWAQIGDNPHTAILSAEDFSRQKNYAAMGAALRGFAVEVVLYVRRQDLFAESLYNQRNKILLQRCSTDPLGQHFLTEEDFFAFLRREAYIPILNFSRLLSEIETHIKPAKVHVREFDRDVLEGADVCRDFCAIFGWDFDRMSKPGHDTNGSVSNTVLTSVNEVFLDQGPEAAKEKMNQINQSIQDGENLSGSYKVLSPKTRNTMQRQYHDINEDLRTRYGVDLTARSGR